MSSIRELPLPWKLDRTRNGPVALAGVEDTRLVLTGTSNYDTPAQEYADKIAVMDDKQFITETWQAVYMAAWAANNPVSDYHWQASACYYEAQRRDNPDLYQQAYDEARRTAGL